MLRQKYDEFRSTSESQLNFYMGLNSDEMAMWWEKHEADIHVDDEDKKLMEEFTGRLPILFQRVSDIGQVGAAEGIDSVQLQRQKLVKLPEVVKIIGAINAYAISKINQLNADGNDSAMQSFQRGWEACIFEQALDAGDCTDLDGRFFLPR